MTVSEELARERIERFERSIWKSEWKLENQDLSEESVSRVHDSIGRDVEKIGLYELLLGDVPAATERFEESTRRFLLKYEHKKRAELEENGQQGWQTQASILQRLLYSAMLSRNDALAADAAKNADDLVAYLHRFPEKEYRYHYTRALASVASQSPDERDRVDAFRESLDDVKPDFLPYFGSIATALDGVVEDDADLVVDGLEAFLERHDEKASEEPEKLSDHVAKRATALVLLAKRRGLDIEIESRYVPDCVL
jgi:hypothetical protein